jgi:outer membrane protein OmpA-like peptidoglycan-associated protein
MNQKTWRILSGLALAGTLSTLTGCETMTRNPALSSAGTAAVVYGICKAAGGSDKGCGAGAVAVGALTYGYLRHQLEQLREIENVQADPCAASQPNREAYCVTMNGKAITFDSGSAAISSSSMQTLNEVAGVLSQSPETLIYIEGHTDSVGSSDVNQRLSEQRAMSVKGVFQKSGIADDRIQALGYGESKPVVNEAADPGNRVLNRRVEIRVEGGAG